MPVYKIKSFALRAGKLRAKDLIENNILYGSLEELYIEIDDKERIMQMYQPLFEFCKGKKLIIEVGIGSGTQIVSAAAENPHCAFLGIEVWKSGIIQCVRSAKRQKLDNLRLLCLDASNALAVLFGLEITLTQQVDGFGILSSGNGYPTGKIDSENPLALNPRADEVWTFFPDPWHKQKHRKRRLINHHFANIVVGVLKSGGIWRISTDSLTYATEILRVIEASDGLKNPHRDFAPRFKRVVTGFEKKAIESGRQVYDIECVRI